MYLCQNKHLEPKYISDTQTIIFSPDYDEPLDIKLIGKHTHIIFSRYKLSSKLFNRYKDCYDNEIGFYNIKKDFIRGYFINSSREKIYAKKNGYIIPSKNIYSKSLDFLPDKISHLIIGDQYNRAINMLSSKLLVLIFDDESIFNQMLNNLPSTLKKLAIGKIFNQSIHYLPSSITHLRFTYDSKFNQSVDNLPSGLLMLKFGNYFNQSVDNLPSGLLVLEFGNYFNKSVDYLPSSLERITFGENFSQSIDNLPNFIKNLRVGKNYNCEISALPTELKFFWPMHDDMKNQLRKKFSNRKICFL